MNAVLDRVASVPPVSEEDRARAEHYAVFSRLFAAAPDAAFLARLPALAGVWGSADSALGRAWLMLGDAMRGADAEAVEDEYTRLFLTIGRPQVTESEDHLAALCDVMRHLVVTGPDAAGLARQQAFFSAHLAPWTDALAEALEHAPEASFYPRTAALVRAFFDIERLAFDML